MDDLAAGYILEPETPRGPLTARNLEDFLQCPRKFLLSFVAGHAESSRFIGAPAALHRAVRDSLLELLATGGSADFHTTFERHFDGQACRDSREEEDCRRDALRILETALHEPLLPPGEPDVRLEVLIDDQPFLAVADWLRRDPPGVFRLTTGRRPPSPAELTARLTPGLLWLAGAAALGEELTAHVVDLRRNRLLPYQPSPDQQQTLRDLITTTAARIRRERQFPANRGAHCRWCRSQSQCPAWKTR